MTTQTETATPSLEQGETQEAERRSAITMWLANNILNNVPLSKIVELVKTASLNDARRMVEQADDAQLDELETQMQQAQQAESTDDTDT